MNTDYFEKDASDLLNKRLFLFDMDGTIYRDDLLFDGAIELFYKIIDCGGKYVFVTNNSSNSIDYYIKKVNKFGIPANKGNFFTSTEATALYLKKYHKNKKVYCQGTRFMINELISLGVDITTNISDNPEVILVGFDTEITGKKIRNTCEVLQRDLPYIATNPDLKCPVSFGFIPDCGSICQMLYNATGKKPIYIGKPEAVMVNFVMDRLGFTKKETCVIGDRLYTDIAAGINAGVDTICVLTGEATVTEIEKNGIKPTYTFENLKDIWEVIR